MDWDYFINDDLYSEILVYWYDKWMSITRDVDRGSIGIEIINVRLVLSDITNEYELNEFKSNNNRIIYIKLIDNLISDNYLKKYRTELIILKEKLERKDYEASYVIAREMQQQLLHANFNQILFDDIFEILKEGVSNKNTRAKISKLTKQIVIDLVSLGINVKDIEALLRDTFKTYFFTGEEYVINYKDLPKSITELDVKEYTIRAKEYIDNLTILDRLNSFQRKLIPNKVKYIFVYPIWGASSRLHEKVPILDGYLYSPEIELVFGDSNNFLDETFKTDDYEEIETDNEEENWWKYQSRLNVMISVSSTSKETAKELAEEKHMQIMSLLNWKYSNDYHEFFWDGQYIGKEADKEGLFGSLGANNHLLGNRHRRQQLSKNSSVYLSSEKISNISNISNIINNLKKERFNYEANTLKNVIKILSKTKWDSQETKLLNYWIVIESLANIAKETHETPYNFVKKVIPNIYFLSEVYMPIQHLFIEIDYYHAVELRVNGLASLPRDYLVKIGINKLGSEDTSISMKPLYESLNELKGFTTKEQLSDEIEETINFYSDNKKTLARLRKEREDVKLTLDYIYKSRNLIVHNGFVDENIIPYLVSFAEGYANSLLNRILDVYGEDNNLNLQHYFMKELYEGELLEKRLSDNTYYDLGVYFK